MKVHIINILDLLQNTRNVLESPYEYTTKERQALINEIQDILNADERDQFERRFRLKDALNRNDVRGLGDSGAVRHAAPLISRLARV